MSASIDHILNATNHQQLFYIGHSLGGLVFYILTAVRPEYNDKIRAMISLAPGTAIPHTLSPTFRLLAPIRQPLDVRWFLLVKTNPFRFYTFLVLDSLRKSSKRSLSGTRCPRGNLQSRYLFGKYYRYKFLQNFHISQFRMGSQAVQ